MNSTLAPSTFVNIPKTPQRMKPLMAIARQIYRDRMPPLYLSKSPSRLALAQEKACATKQAAN